MKFLSYFFALALVFSSVSCRDLTEENSSVNAEKAFLEVQEKLNSFTAEESRILQEGLVALAESLKETLENSEAYKNLLKLLQLKGLDISFFVNIVEAKNKVSSVEELIEEAAEELDLENEELFTLD